MVIHSAARPDAIRRHNLSLVLHNLHRDGALTRAELTQRLGVSRSTVAALVNDLTALGLVKEEVPSGGAGVGRPSHLVTLDPGGPFAIAVDVDVTHVTVAAVGLGGEVLARAVVPIDHGSRRPERVAAIVVESAARVGETTGRPGRPAGIGVSVPGTIDIDTGLVTVAPNLDWHDVEFGTLLADALAEPCRVHVGNDADLAVTAEHVRGSARGCDDVVYLLGRVGVGAGIITHGAPLRGHSGHAGEIGHNVIDASGAPCHCGKNGCTETYLGDAAILAATGRTLPVSDDAIADVLAAAQAGEPAALDGLRRMAEPLGRTIGTLVNTLNPQRVVLGGSFTTLLAVAREEIEASLAHYALAASRRHLELVAPHFGPDAPLVGAAEIALAGLLTDPLAADALHPLPS